MKRLRCASSLLVDSGGRYPSWREWQIGFTLKSMSKGDVAGRAKKGGLWARDGAGVTRERDARGQARERALRGLIR